MQTLAMLDCRQCFPANKLVAPCLPARVGCHVSLVSAAEPPPWQPEMATRNVRGLAEGLSSGECLLEERDVVVTALTSSCDLLQPCLVCVGPVR